MEEVPRDGFEFSAPIPNADERIAFIADPVVAEHARLERAVIEAAIAERKAALDYDKRMNLENWKRTVDTRQQRESAVDAMTAFDSQQQVKK